MLAILFFIIKILFFGLIGIGIFLLLLFCDENDAFFGFTGTYLLALSVITLIGGIVGEPALIFFKAITTFLVKIIGEDYEPMSYLMGFVVDYPIGLVIPPWILIRFFWKASDRKKALLYLPFILILQMLLVMTTIKFLYTPLGGLLFAITLFQSTIGLFKGGKGSGSYDPDESGMYGYDGNMERDFASYYRDEDGDLWFFAYKDGRNKAILKKDLDEFEEVEVEKCMQFDINGEVCDMQGKYYYPVN